MQKTSNYNLNKPEAADPLRLADFNENAEIIDGLLSGCARVECGTYTGTGTYGEENPSTLTFGIEPKIVFLFNAEQYGGLANTTSTNSAAGTSNQVYYANGSEFRVYWPGESAGCVYYTLSGNTMSRYNSLNASLQMNGSDVAYGYVAIG